MNELVRVTVKDNEQVVSARELHKALELSDKFGRWWQGVCNTLEINEKEYGGYTLLTDFNRSFNDFLLPVDLAKEIAMVSKSKKSGMIRKYFIEIEKAWNNPELQLARSLQYSQSKLLEHERKIQQLTYTVDLLVHDDQTYTFSEIAKDKDIPFTSAIALCADLHKREIIFKNTAGRWLPYSKHSDCGYFAIKSEIQNNGYNVTFTKVTGKGRLFILNLYNNMFNER